MRQAQQRQITQYEKAVKYFHGRKFVRALSFFDQVGEGPNDALRNRARVYAQICRSRREGRKARLKTADDHYNYAVKLMNDRRLDEADQHLERALKLEASADHIHYARGVVRALKGDLAGAFECLKRAITLDSKNRYLALHDADLASAKSNPEIRELLHSDGRGSVNS